MAVTLECRGLDFSYRDKPVLSQVSFKVHSGRFCAILGRNGSGKTTLLHCLNRILTPESGEILIHGQNIMTMDQTRIARNVSLVPQEHPDIFPYRVMDVVVMGRAPFLGISRRPGQADYKMALDALDFLNCGSLAEKNFNRISGGERQMSLLARAITQGSRVMLMDEPTNHLDFNNQYHMLSAMRTLCRTRGISIVASMHDPNMAALFAHDLIMVKDGSIMAQGPADRVLTGENISSLYETRLSQVRLNGDKKIFFPEKVLRGLTEGEGE